MLAPVVMLFFYCIIEQKVTGFVLPFNGAEVGLARNAADGVEVAVEDGDAGPVSRHHQRRARLPPVCHGVVGVDVMAVALAYHVRHLATAHGVEQTTCPPPRSTHKTSVWQASSFIIVHHNFTRSSMCCICWMSLSIHIFLWAKILFLFFHFFIHSEVPILRLGPSDDLRLFTILYYIFPIR